MSNNPNNTNTANPDRSKKRSATVSHIALAGTGLYSLIRVREWTLLPAHATFGIITVNNTIAAYRCITEDAQPEDGVYVYTAYLQFLFALPCINATMWMMKGYKTDLCLAWALAPVFPLVCFFVNGEIDKALVEILMLIEIIGMGRLSYIEGDHYGMGAVLAFSIAHFFVKRIASYNFAMCLFTYFSLRAIGVESIFDG